jgi:hypothetical protein
MNVRHSRLGRLVALTVVVSMPVLGMAGVASAHTTHATHAKAAKKHKKGSGAGGSTGTGGSTGSGTGGPPVDITVTASPNPLVETGQSEVHTIIQVETLPSFAGDAVTISSSQLVASCEKNSVVFDTIATAGAVGGGDVTSYDTITVILDDDGNATVGLSGINCAPGTSVIEADLDVAPYLTALTTLVANPPVVTTPGLTGSPNDEVETGDTTGLSGNSDVYAVFYVEDSPVYAEQEVEISSSQLEARCGQGWIWLSGNDGTSVPTVNPVVGGVTTLQTGVNTGKAVETQLDDDGNAVFIFKGASCAAGDSQVIADVLAGTHDTFTFDYTIDPPAPTI